MIKCFRCGTPAKQEPDGTVYRMCDCYASPLIMQPALDLTDADPISVMPVIAAGKLPSEVAPDQARRIYTMITNRIAVHKADCSGCKALGRSCFEILPVEELQKKWQKKAGIS